MRPPICAVCNKRFSEGGGLIQFKLSETDKERKKLFDQPGFVGHPPGLEWFCSEHINEAKKLKHLTLPEAMKILREKFL